MSAAPNAAALAVREPAATVAADPSTAMTPRSIDEGLRLASIVAKSGLFGVSSPEDAFVRIAMGLELGMTPTAALRNIHSIKGRPVIDAAAMVGLCLAKPGICVRFECTETTDESATWTAQRVGQRPITLSFTLAQAKGANLLGKETWRSFPAAMLRARAASALARIVFPDLMSGIYTPEELDGLREERPAPTEPAPAEPARARASRKAPPPTAEPAPEPATAQASPTAPPAPTEPAQASPVELEARARSKAFAAEGRWQQLASHIAQLMKSASSRAELSEAGQHLRTFAKPLKANLPDALPVLRAIYDEREADLDRPQALPSQDRDDADGAEHPAAEYPAEAGDR